MLLYTCFFRQVISHHYLHTALPRKGSVPIFTPSLIPTTLSHCRASFPFHPPNFFSLVHYTTHPILAAWHAQCCGSLFSCTSLATLLCRASVGEPAVFVLFLRFHSGFIATLNPLQKPSWNYPLKCLFTWNHTRFSTFIVVDFVLPHMDFLKLKGPDINSSLKIQAYVLKLKFVCVSSLYIMGTLDFIVCVFSLYMKESD